MSDKEFNEYIKAFASRPHLVILGAGATMATIPNGDKNGMKSSVMNNFIEELGLSYILNNIKLETNSRNIEYIYSELFSKDEYKVERENLEQAIFQHFKLLELPDSPTIYDLLIISLRKKDCIASFNWDNLLIQAYQRVRRITKDLPNLLFLHGNVDAGYCSQCECHYGKLDHECPECREPFTQSPLLFPVKKKDYSSNPFIRIQWEQLRNKIENAGFLTIFGYSAPSTDFDAIRIMEEAFSTESKFWHEIEVIDIGNKSEIEKNWAFFGERTRWHFKVVNSFFDSILAEFPRRSIEGYYKRNLDPRGGWWGESQVRFTPANYKNLKMIVKPLLDKENKRNFDIL